HHWPMGLIFLVVLALGAVAGAINGLLVTRVGLPSLAVTIGTLTLYRGLANVVLGPATVSNFPSTYTNLGVNGVFGISWLSYSLAIFIGKGTILGVALAAFVYAGLRSALLLTSSFDENDFQVVTGGLLILSVLVPNAASFLQRARALLRRGQMRGRGRLLASAAAAE